MKHNKISVVIFIILCLISFGFVYGADSFGDGRNLSLDLSFGWIDSDDAKSAEACALILPSSTTKHWGLPFTYRRSGSPCLGPENSYNIVAIMLNALGVAAITLMATKLITKKNKEL